VGKFVNKTAVIKVNNVDISQYVSSIEVNSEKERVDVTGMTASAYREETDGFATAEISMTVFQDFASTAGPHAVLRPLYESGTIFAITVKPESAGTLVIHMDQAKLYNYSPTAGGVGDASSFDASFSNAGTAGITYGTA
jgi:hypothetical protein